METPEHRVKLIQAESEQLGHYLHTLVAENQARLELAGTAHAHVRYRCDTATFVLLMYGRLPLAGALATGRLWMDGEAELVTAFAQWFRGV